MSKHSSLFLSNKPELVSYHTDSAPKCDYKILFVDDEPNVLKALKRVFRAEKNYEVFTAENANTGMQILEKEKIDVLVSDFRMPVKNGAEFLRDVKAKFPCIIRMMLTGDSDTQAVMGAIKDGAVYKFILKPWNDDDLRLAISLALEQKELLEKNSKLKEENDKKKKEVSALKEMSVKNSSQLAIFLSKNSALTVEQLEELNNTKEKKHNLLISKIIDNDWVKEKNIRKLLRDKLLIEQVDLNDFMFDSPVIDCLSKAFCLRQLIIPLKKSDQRLLIAMADPLDDGLLSELRFKTQCEVDVVMADIHQIKEKINLVYGDEDEILDFTDKSMILDPFEQIEVVIDENDDIPLDVLLNDSKDPPAVRLANAVILEAVSRGVSDIHIQPSIKYSLVRYRIDGILLDKIKFSSDIHPSLISRFKIMAELDISERRMPQDGRITVKTPLKVIDLRISTIPTLHGEKLVLRILDRQGDSAKLCEQGFNERNQRKIDLMTAMPQGIILATGPTGSGKTTTLYSLIQSNLTTEKNYVTIENPVEIHLETGSQINVNEKIGRDFAEVLRAILRQDPDVILVGEIRDAITAEVAFHAAMTGHVVYSSLHTNSASATIARLIDLGLKPYLISSGLAGIIAQRLLRKTCTYCMKNSPPDQKMLSMLGGKFKNYQGVNNKGAGCDKCNHTGYIGRLPIHEILVVTDRIRNMINNEGAAANYLIESHLKDNMLTDDAYEKVINGVTNIEEVYRVLGPQIMDIDE